MRIASWYNHFRARRAKSNCLKAISQLRKIFFEIYIKRDYLKKHYFYERKIHYALMRVLACIHTLRRYGSSEEIESILCLLDAVIALGQLRYRVKDYATFEIIQMELEALLAGIQEEKIIALENNYYNTLNVVAADPLVFLLFIEALKQNLRHIKVCE